ncbi:S35B1-like protein [Mya arenaria]|uniref:S35B1-like protein n=1 Tax=Mya arenaria TaxID=6604 RepID=A0ABY7E7Q3_MYAAR|nr:S35B1-like protein [Mya arenaria]
MSSYTKDSDHSVDLHIVSSRSRDIKGDSINMSVAGQGRKKFLVCALGVFVSYFYYGILQESMDSAGKYVLGKSVKPIPVMILGILLAKKRYPAAKFLFILMICMGVALFMFKDKPAVADESHGFGFGEVLLLVSLTLDGLVVTGEGLAFLGFMERFPSILIKMVTFGIASAIGQVFIFITVTSFGPLPCSIITTTRKFFTILGSVIIFQNPINSRQWAGTVLVFMGLGLDSAYGKEKKDIKNVKNVKNESR